MHDVIHVSLLKKYVPNSEHVLDLDDKLGRVLDGTKTNFENQGEATALSGPFGKFWYNGRVA